MIIKDTSLISRKLRKVQDLDLFSSQSFTCHKYSDSNLCDHLLVLFGDSVIFKRSSNNINHTEKILDRKIIIKQSLLPIFFSDYVFSKVLWSLDPSIAMESLPIIIYFIELTGLRIYDFSSLVFFDDSTTDMTLQKTMSELLYDSNRRCFNTGRKLVQQGYFANSNEYKNFLESKKIFSKLISFNTLVNQDPKYDLDNANHLIELTVEHLRKFSIEDQPIEDDEGYRPARLKQKFISFIESELYSCDYFTAMPVEFFQEDLIENIDFESSTYLDFADYKYQIDLFDDKLFPKFKELNGGNIEKYIFRRPEIKQLIFKKSFNNSPS